MTDEKRLGPEHFARQDESDDALFYTMPRMVTHIDDPAIEALTGWFRGALPPGADLLDLMSSCVSHLPGDVTYGRVAGLGMNEAELDANERLTERIVHDLTRDPALPYEDASFDACLITVSVQYLVHPLQVFAEIARVLKPGGRCHVSFSNRCFPTKAIALWLGLDDHGHAQLVGHYFLKSGGFDHPEFADLSPAHGRSDPLYMVHAPKAG